MNAEPQNLTDLPILLLPERLAVCRLPAETDIPGWAQSTDLLSITRTRNELSIVCAERLVPPEVRAESGWRVFQVQGPLDFALIGMLAALVTPLSQAGVSVFALSTYETDYILVKESALPRAQQALTQAGFLVLHVHLPA